MARRIGIILTLVLLAALPAIGGDAEARRGAHVETGQELYDACLTAVGFAAPPQGRPPTPYLVCKRYIANYFTVLEMLHNDPRTQKVHPHDEAERFQCAWVPGARSFEQMARQIVRVGDWEPALLAGPAVDLIKKAFDTLDPC